MGWREGSFRGLFFISKRTNSSLFICSYVSLSHRALQTPPMVEEADWTNVTNSNHHNVSTGIGDGSNGENDGDENGMHGSGSNSNHRFPCSMPECGRSYSTLGNLKTHLRMHKV